MPRASTGKRTLVGVVLAVVMAAGAVVALPSAASAQTVADVEARDQLIANQEALLNTYRCRFDIDTQIVPEGCIDDTPSRPAEMPAPFTGTPTRADIAARDSLVRAQEALLNTYRCRFDIDTQIVPGGCIDGVPAPVEEPAPAIEPMPTEEPDPPLPALRRPPGGLRLDPFYQKYLDAFGIPIVSSAAVPDRAHYQAKELFHEVLANRPDLLEALATTRTHVAIMAEDEVITDIPEFRWLYQLAPGRDWDVVLKGGGLAPNTAIPVLAVAVENLICLDSDRAPHADVMIHEIAHAVLTMAIEFKLKDSRFRSRVESAYESALGAGLWRHTYAATNSDEYWAEGTLAWFNLNSPPGPINNEVNTRAELVEYDPTLAALLEQVYGDASAPSSCHELLDISYNTVEGVVLGPDGEPIQRLLLWFGEESDPDRTWSVTGPDGSFLARVPNGSYIINVYADPSVDCSLVGWYGVGGFTTHADQITPVEAQDQDVQGVEITLPDNPGNLPYIEQCAPEADQQSELAKELPESD